MNLGAALEIYGGGPGSGCHGPNCGRPEGPHSVSTEERFRDAKTGEWTPERQAFHQSIVDAAVAGKEPAEGRRPIAYVMGGGTASGKTTASERVIGKNPGAVRVARTRSSSRYRSSRITRRRNRRRHRPWCTKSRAT